MKTTKKNYSPSIFFFEKNVHSWSLTNLQVFNPRFFLKKISMENKGTHLRSHAQSLSKPNLNRITSRPLTSLPIWCADMVVLSSAEQMQVRKCKSEGLKVIHTYTHTKRDTHPTRPTPNRTTTKFLLGSHLDTTLFLQVIQLTLSMSRNISTFFFYKKAFDWCQNFIVKQAYLENKAADILCILQYALKKYPQSTLIGNI